MCSATRTRSRETAGRRWRTLSTSASGARIFRPRHNPRRRPDRPEVRNGLIADVTLDVDRTTARERRRSWTRAATNSGSVGRVDLGAACLRAKSLVRRHDPTEAGDALRGVYSRGANHPPRAQRLLDQRGSLGGIGLPMVRGLPATRRLSANHKMGSRSRRLVQAKRRGTSCSRRHRGFLGFPIRTSAAEIGHPVLFAQL